MKALLRHVVLNVVIRMSTRAASRCLRRLTLRPRVVRFGLLQRGAFLRKLWAFREILGAIEINVAVDEGRLDARIDAEPMSVPDRDVSILADFDRTDAILNTELNRGIDRDELERLFFGQVTRSEERRVGK